MATLIELGTVQPDDLEPIQRLALALFPERYDDAFFVGLYDWSRDTFLVARDGHDGDLLGFAVAVVQAPEEAKVLLIGTTEAVRGQGVGNRLFEALGSRLRRGGVRSVSLEVREDNTSAVGFYRRQRFQVTGRLERFYRDGAAALTMARDL